MNKPVQRIEGASIRKKLRDSGKPGGEERLCCGGRRQFNRNYEAQLKLLGMHGSFIVQERGIIVAKVHIP